MNEQGFLAPVFHFEEKGAEIRELLNRAIVANGVSLTELARETGIDEKQIGRSLRAGGGAHPPLALIAAIVWKDRLGVFLRGFCSMAGYDAIEKKPDLAAENRRLREALTVAIQALQQAAEP